MSTGSLQSLRFAARPGVLVHHLGHLLVPLGVLTCVPAAAAWGFDHSDVALVQLSVAAALVSLGAAGRFLGPREELQRNEALVLTAMAFFVASVAGAAAFAAYGMSPLDAWFEAVSGITTTGLSMLASVDDAPRGLLFARAWLQWIGGLGVLVLALALLITPGASARHLGFDSREMADLAEGTRAHARRVVFIYLTLTAVGIAALVALGMGLFDAVAHVFAGVSTGGFATRDDSLASFPLRQQVGVLAVCLSGAIAFSCYYLTLYRHPLRILRDPRLTSLLVCCAVVGAALVGVALLQGGGETPDVVGLLTTAVSAQTTAGFSTLPVADQSPAARLVLIGAMSVGGELGSTAGGIKIFRFLVVFRLLMLSLNRASIPTSGRLSLRLDRDRIEPDEVEGVVAVVVAYVGLVLGSWLVFLLYGHDSLDSLFEVTSAVGTVGLSAGLTSAGLEPLLKTVLCLDMLMGRVEVIAFLLLLRPSTWIGRRRRS